MMAVVLKANQKIEVFIFVLPMPCALEALTVIKTFSGRSTIQFVREQVK